MLGFRHTAESKAKISKAKKGRKATPEQIEKNRLGHLGRHPSEATRRKYSEAGKRKIWTPEHLANLKAAGLKRRGEKRRPKTEQEKQEIRERMLRHLAVNKKKSTDIELAIEAELVRRQIHFVKQKRLLNFLVDFYLPDYEVVIECDGCFWHACPECDLPRDPNFIQKTRAADERRDTLLLQAGYEVFRFWQHEILKSASECVDRLCV